jgi:type I restriction enzyme, S subunit
VRRAYVYAASPWLGRIPEDWVESRFRYEVFISGGQVDPRVEPWSDMVLVAPNHIESGTGRLLGRETAADQGADSGKYVVAAGQILYSKIRPALNKVAIAVEDCLCSADMYAISLPDRLDTRFARYFMSAKPFHDFATAMSMRVKMPKVNREELADGPWLLPQLPEQRAVADYLDRETARIDTLIEEQQCLIEMLRERRVAVVRHATELAQGSEVRLGWFARISSGDAISIDQVSRGDQTAGPIPVTGGNGVMGYSNKSNVNGTVLAIGRVGALCGNVHRVDGPAWITDNALRLDDIRSFDMVYLRWFLEGRNLNTLSRSTAQPLITGSQVSALRVGCPPVAEQRRIAAHLDEQTAKIDTLITETKRFIELARERRSALITAAVTGQIDVREMV